LQPAKVTAGSSQQGPAAVHSSVTLDLRGMNGSDSVFALRYGWPFSKDTCCPQRTVLQVRKQLVYVQWVCLSTFCVFE
jgi:hypothetical protein